MKSPRVVSLSGFCLNLQCAFSFCHLGIVCINLPLFSVLYSTLLLKLFACFIFRLGHDPAIPRHHAAINIFIRWPGGFLGLRSSCFSSVFLRKQFIYNRTFNVVRKFFPVQYRNTSVNFPVLLTLRQCSGGTFRLLLGSSIYFLLFLCL